MCSDHGIRKELITMVKLCNRLLTCNYKSLFFGQLSSAIVKFKSKKSKTLLFLCKFFVIVYRSIVH